MMCKKTELNNSAKKKKLLVLFTGRLHIKEIMSSCNCI